MHLYVDFSVLGIKSFVKYFIGIMGIIGFLRFCDFFLVVAILRYSNFVLWVFHNSEGLSLIRGCRHDWSNHVKTLVHLYVDFSVLGIESFVKYFLGIMGILGFLRFCDFFLVVAILRYSNFVLWVFHNSEGLSFIRGCRHDWPNHVKTLVHLYVDFSVLGIESFVKYFLDIMSILVFLRFCDFFFLVVTIL